MKYVITGLLLLFSSVAFAGGYDVYVDTNWDSFNDAPEEPGEYVGLKIRDGRFFCERIKKEVEEKSISSYTPLPWPDCGVKPIGHHCP